MAIQGLLSGDLKVRALNGVLIATDGIVTATSFSSGSSGTSGSSGSSGTSATSGTAGTSATSGTAGTSGSSGSAGTSGSSATSGSSGTSATAGTSGSSATSGTSGTSATDGTGGTSGTSGSSATSGSSGTSATSGSSGSSGTSATDGTGGSSGSSGTSATSGTSGSSATSGTAGTSGSSATSGTSGTSGLQGDRYATTSSTTFTLGNAGTITVGTQLAYTIAQSIIVVYDANNFQECEVTAYNPATGSLSFAAPTRTVGSGTYSAWSVNLDGASGGDGSSGTSGTSATAGTSGSTGTSGSSGSSGSSGTSGSSGSAGTSGTTGRNGIDGSSGASIANWYGAFTSTATQVVTAANTPTAITYTNDEYSNGIVFSGSQLTVQHTGIYEIAYSLQIEHTGGGGADVNIWLRKNGTNIIRTDSILGLRSQSAKQLPFVSIIDSANANDYYEVYFQANASDVQVTAVAATGTIPAAPSIITNIKQIGIAVGTTSGTSGSSGSSGSSGINGSSGNTGSSGSAGSSGSSGTSGVDGSTGSSGSAGSSGSSGSSGTTGTSGSSATSGTSGTSGSAGSSGSSGTTGTSGTSATSGSTGTSGSSGTSGNATTSARAVQTFTSTSGQTTFTVTNGYNLGMIDVFVNGVKFVNGTDFTATDGTTVALAAGLAAGNIVEIDNLLTAYLPTNALRTITTFTATAGQTTFSVTYTQGLIDVFYNGSNLAQSEYTATNGTSIILATACQLNDIVVVYAYSYSVGAYSGIGGSGTINTIPKFTAASTIGDSAITDNGTTVTLVSRALSGTSASFSSTATATAFIPSGATIPSNGMYLSASNTLNFATNSTNRLIITSAGDVGIATNSPIGSLNIQGTNIAQEGSSTNPAGITFGVQSSQPRISLDNGTGAADIAGNQWCIDNSGGTLRFFTAGVIKFSLASTGVASFSGFGSNSFSSGGTGYNKLTIRNTTAGVANGAQLSIGTNADPDQFYVQSFATTFTTSGMNIAGGAVVNGEGPGGLSLAATQSSIGFYTNGAAAGNLRMTIASTGLVGIGTSSPTNASLHIANPIASETIRNQDNAAYISFYNAAGTTRTGYIQYNATSASAFVLDIAQDFTFNTSGIERMRITSGGSVGVGISGVYSDVRLMTRGASATSADYSFRAENSSAGNILYLRNDGLIVSGTLANSPTNYTTGSAANMFVSGGGEFQRSTSSLKYKTDVRNYDKGLTEVLQMRPVYYKGKNDGDTQFAGLIAEEIHELGLTEFVQYAEDGTPDALAYSNMIALLTKAIQEMNTKIIQLEKIVATK